MSDAYERAKGGRLAFKGGALATRAKDIDKKKKKKKNSNKKSLNDDGGGVELSEDPNQPSTAGSGAAGEIYTIDAAKKMKYDELFPVEAKKFGYDPNAKSKTIEEALDDRVKKKADRYCK